MNPETEDSISRKMLFEPFEPQQRHDLVGAVFSKVTNPSQVEGGSDVYGATTLINEYLQYVQTRLQMTQNSNLPGGPSQSEGLPPRDPLPVRGVPVGPLLDQMIDTSEIESEYLQDFLDTKNSLILSDLDRRILLVGEFCEYIKEWLENAADDSISNDTSYCIIYHVSNDPFMWSLFREILPPKILVADMSSNLNVISSPKLRGPLIPINIMQARMGLALSSLGIRIDSNGFLAIYHAVTHICIKANNWPEMQFTELLQSIPVELVNETPLHQLGLKLITVIVYEFANKPRESTIVYKETLKAILDNSRWPHFKKHLSDSSSL